MWYIYKRCCGCPLLQFFMAGILLLIFILFLISFFPTEGKLQRSATVVESSHYYQLEVNGVPLIFFSALTSDSAMAGIALHPDSVERDTRLDTACWIHRFPVIPSCRGRLLTRANTDSISAAEIPMILERERSRLDSIVPLSDHADDELRYYLAIHNVTDEGYNMIADYNQQHLRRLNMLHKAQNLLNAISEKDSLHVRRITIYKVVVRSSDGLSDTIICEPYRRNGDWLYLSTFNRQTPEGVEAVFQYGHHLRFIAGRPVPESKKKPTHVANGHGAWSDHDGSYYEGNWENNFRNGFGFCITNKGRLKAGLWKNDVFKGEKMAYSSDRIYGIDISRYQHESGKRRYAIDWNNMRITHLGHISNKKIIGKVDYPVRFIFIKATQGTTISNPYYQKDYAAARKKGIRVGSYHFFSVKKDGVKQATYFLKNARFNSGDLPPVLDVEPSEAQIRLMGGPKELLRQVRAFSEEVLRKTGMRPILYVNQMFVNRHLANTPDIKHDYQLWIARYGEYKPDVRLSFWQLAPDGRVKGIHGDVDINVFNGYQDKFNEYLDNSTY